MTVLEGEITDTFICTSFVLQILRGSAKQDHFKYELLCISHTKNILKKVFTFLHVLSLSFKKKSLKSPNDNTEANNMESKLEQ